MSSDKPLVDRHDGAIILLDLLFAQSQVSHKGHVEVPLNHPGMKLSEMGGQAKEDTWAERCRRSSAAEQSGPHAHPHASCGRVWGGAERH